MSLISENQIKKCSCSVTSVCVYGRFIGFGYKINNKNYKKLILFYVTKYEDHIKVIYYAYKSFRD